MLSDEIKPEPLPRIELYPEKELLKSTDFDSVVISIISFFVPFFTVKIPWDGSSKIAKATRKCEKDIWSASDYIDNLLPKTLQVLKKTGSNKNIDQSGRLLSIISRAAFETLGQKPYDVQISAAWSLMRGEIAEMGTGEGKSLTAAVASAALALKGQRVHILTVNDYLADRDAARFRPFFEKLGLSSGHIGEETSSDMRKEIYKRDIVFTAAKNVVFDFLRDKTGPQSHMLNAYHYRISILNRSLKQDESPLLQGLDAVIIDEADSVLIDQAATPFILSGGEASLGGVDASVLEEVLSIAHTLTLERHFRIYKSLRRAILTEEGKFQLEQIDKKYSILQVAPIREHIACQALVALHLLERDTDYLVHEEKIQIIDESTGRVMPDRQWSDGLHQLVELKENLPPSEIRSTLGRITFQRFFPRYRHICGMSGTVAPSLREIWESYGLRVRKILPRLPDQRRWDKVSIFETLLSKWSQIALTAAKNHQSGIPTLIGTRTVTASRECSAALQALDIPHSVLNAEEVAKEAGIISRAGEAGRVTVATNMAGRGTDIELSEAAVSVGGLHVILSELHENRRIDLQLAGRCGRQGNPGRVSYFLSLEDGILDSTNSYMLMILKFLFKTRSNRLIFSWLVSLQYLQTKRSVAARRRLQRYERQREKSLAISGVLE